MLVTSTRDPGMRVSFVEAAERNAPADGGLYLPVLGPGGLEPFADVEELLALPFRPRSVEILSREYRYLPLKEQAKRSYDTTMDMLEKAG